MLEQVSDMVEAMHAGWPVIAPFSAQIGQFAPPIKKTLYSHQASQSPLVRG